MAKGGLGACKDDLRYEKCQDKCPGGDPGAFVFALYKGPGIKAPVQRVLASLVPILPAVLILLSLLLLAQP